MQAHENLNSKKNEINILFKTIVTEYKNIINFDDFGNQFLWSLLSICCSRTHIECIKIILDLCIENGNKNNFAIDINRMSRFRQTAITDALKERKIEVIQLLLDSKYYLFNKNLDLNQKLGDLTIMEYCEKHQLTEYSQLFQNFDNSRQ